MHRGVQHAQRSTACTEEYSMHTGAQHAHRSTACTEECSMHTGVQHAHRSTACRFRGTSLAQVVAAPASCRSPPKPLHLHLPKRITCAPPRLPASTSRCPRDRRLATTCVSSPRTSKNVAAASPLRASSRAGSGPSSPRIRARCTESAVRARRAAPRRSSSSSPTPRHCSPAAGALVEAPSPTPLCACILLSLPLSLPSCTASAAAASSMPPNSSVPVAASNRVQPRDHMSHAGVAGRPRMA
jgi:hypothetical protein